MHTHLAFTDESCWNANQFRSLSLVTVDAQNFDLFMSDLENDLKTSEVSEFKWQKLESAKYRFCAEKLVKTAIKHAIAGHIRIDVISWDINDSRHSVPGRCDLQNLGRMYYHLLSNCFRTKWPDKAVWKIIPDEHTGLDWSGIEKSLRNKETTLEMNSDDFFQPDASDFASLYLRRNFQIHHLEQGKSEEHPILQLADFFAGLTAFSRNHYDKYDSWQDRQEPSLFTVTEEIPHSKRDIERFATMKHFNDAVKQQKFQISLKTAKGFRSLGSGHPINIWWYIPQGNYDVAPSRL